MNCSQVVQTMQQIASVVTKNILHQVPESNPAPPHQWRSVALINCKTLATFKSCVILQKVSNMAKRSQKLAKVILVTVS